jgi:hypothetical protein
MKKDPIVAEIRRTRDAHAARFNYDVEAIVCDLAKRDKASRRKLYSFQPRKTAKV